MNDEYEKEYDCKNVIDQILFFLKLIFIGCLSAVVLLLVDQTFGFFHKSEYLPETFINFNKYFWQFFDNHLGIFIILFIIICFWFGWGYVRNLSYKNYRISNLEKLVLFLSSFFIFYDFLNSEVTIRMNLFLSISIFTICLTRIVFPPLVRHFLFKKKGDEINSISIADEPLNTIEDLINIEEVVGQKDGKDLFDELKNKVTDFSKKIRDGEKSEIENQAMVYCLDSSWGAGKTSFINMVEHEVYKKELEKTKWGVPWVAIKDYFNIKRPNDIIWIDYNPWHFNNDTELIRDFFNTLEVEIGKLYGNNLGGTFRKYSELVTPVLEDQKGGWKVASKILQVISKEKTLNELKGEIVNRLGSVNEKVVIVLDDIDRLVPKQVMLVMRLVKIISDFPNIVFVLPMDYGRVSEVVEKAYGEQYRNYLQKIVNFKIGLPEYGYEQLEGIFFSQMVGFYRYSRKKEEIDEIVGDDGFRKKIKEFFESYIYFSKRKQLVDFYRNNAGMSEIMFSPTYLIFKSIIEKMCPTLGFRRYSIYKIDDDHSIISNQISETIIRYYLEGEIEFDLCIHKEFIKKVINATEEVSQDLVRTNNDNSKTKRIQNLDGPRKEILKKSLEEMEEDDAKYLDNHKKWLVENLLTPRDVKHFANKLIENQNNLNWLKDSDELNKIIQETIDSQVFPSL